MGFLSDLWDEGQKQRDAVVDGGLKGAWEHDTGVVKDSWYKTTDWATDRKAKEEEQKKKEEEAIRLEGEREAKVQKALDESPTSALDTRNQITANAKRKGRQSTLLTGGGGERGTLGGTKSRKTLLGN